MATAFGLLHADYRMPSLDYESLLRVAWTLTGDIGQVLEQFRRATFNLLAVNRDDHSKNHGYLMDTDGSWRLSPAYDLTFSEGPGGEHWTAYLGEGRHPSTLSLLKLAEMSSLSVRQTNETIERVREALVQLPDWCRDLGVPRKFSAPIITRLHQMS